jgi:outer membrane protein TolC
MNQNKMRVYVLALIGLFFIGHAFAQQMPQTVTLEEAIDYAIANNHDAKIAGNNRAAAKQKKWETTTIGLPQINGQVDYRNWLKQQVSLLPGELAGGDPGTFIPVQFGTKQTVNATVTIDQLIFDGSYLVGLQSAKTYLKIYEQAQEKTVLTIREAVINAYGNVLVAEKSLSILDRNVVVLEKTLKDAQKIYQNGFNEEEDVEQLQITLTTLKSQVNKTKRLKEIAYKMLNLSMGNSTEVSLVLTDDLDALVLQHMNLSLLSKNFKLEDHVDFKIAENDRESKRLLMQLEKSKALPSLSAFVNFGYAGNANNFDFFNSSQTWFDSSMLGVSLRIPIFSSFQRRSKTKQASIELNNSDIRLTLLKEQLRLGVAKAKSEYQFSIEQYDASKQNLNLAERIEKKQQIKFFEGVSSSFELSQAQNQLYTQQQNYIQSMLDVIAKKAALENALNIPLN